MPPEKLRSSSASPSNTSFVCEPFQRAHAEAAADLDAPFVAGMLSMAAPSIASSLLMVGSPQPAARARDDLDDTADGGPFASRAASITAIMRAAASASGQRTRLRSVSSQSRFAASTSATHRAGHDAHADRREPRLCERPPRRGRRSCPRPTSVRRGGIAHAVLLRVRVVRVPGTIDVLERAVVLRALVGIAHEHEDRRAERDAFVRPRRSRLVGFLALRRDRALAGGARSRSLWIAATSTA